MNTDKDIVTLLQIIALLLIIGVLSVLFTGTWLRYEMSYFKERLEREGGQIYPLDQDDEFDSLVINTK
jgi:hypothetical protein